MTARRDGRMNQRAGGHPTGRLPGAWLGLLRATRALVRAMAAHAGLAALAAGLWALSGCSSTPTRIEAPPPAPSSSTSEPVDPERRARVRLELAGAYFANGQVDTALAEVQQALVQFPDLADAYNLRGLIHAALGDDALAEEGFRRAAQLNPRDGGVPHNHGWFLCQRGRYAEAQARFEAALAVPQYRDRQRTLMARGVCHARNHQLPEAEAALMKAYELDPSNPGAGFSLAEVLFQQQAFERARFYINRVNDTAGAANAQSLWLAVRIAYRQGLASDARMLGERLRARFPQSPEATLYDRGRFDD